MMDEKESMVHERRVAVFKALAHPSRLYIILRIAEGEACVSDLTAEIGADVSTVSKHLAILRDVGLVADRREGQNILYSLACGCILDFIHCVDAVAPPGDPGCRRRPICAPMPH
ncbi:MAG: ArsR family transcriptional regulator [Spirochaetes bacterium]|nr:MAG: ArsR family transcriptional regulator [Spirochaetota bacterium]